MTPARSHPSPSPPSLDDDEDARDLSRRRLAVVCPMANEQDNAARFVADVLENCAGFKEVKLFVVLDQVSQDGTRDILDAVALAEPRLAVVWAPENRSVVDAYVRGYREAIAAGCDWVLEIDAGYSHRPSEISRFVQQLRTGDWDCVFGSRFCRGGVIEQSSLRRSILSWAGTRLSNLLLGTRLRDMTSGFQLFRRTILDDLVSRGITSRGHFFQTEMKFRCRNLRIAEVPISYSFASPDVSRASIHDALSVLFRLTRERVGAR